VTGRRNDLHEVVRGHVGGHADRDALGAVDEQVGQGGRQHVRLHVGAVVVRHEVDDVLVEVRDHREGGPRLADLGVPLGGRPVVERPEVAVPVDEREPHGEVLREADHGVVDGRVAVGVELSHDVADDAGGLHVRLVRTQAHLVHLEQDAALDGLEAIACVRQRAGVDDRVRVLEERALHLGGDVDVDDVLVSLGRLGTCGHGFDRRIPAPPRRCTARDIPHEFGTPGTSEERGVPNWCP
jgi:hypothetical protein